MARDDAEEIEQDDEGEELLEDEGWSGGSGVGFLVGFVLGALVGAGTALLLAPDRGDVTRRRIGRRVRRLREGAVDRIEEVRDGAERELRRAKRRVRRHLPD
jgi:gas vesicle protein